MLANKVCFFEPAFRVIAPCVAEFSFDLPAFPAGAAGLDNILNFVPVKIARERRYILFGAYRPVKYPRICSAVIASIVSSVPKTLWPQGCPPK